MGQFIQEYFITIYFAIAILLWLPTSIYAIAKWWNGDDRPIGTTGISEALFNVFLGSLLWGGIFIIGPMVLALKLEEWLENVRNKRVAERRREEFDNITRAQEAIWRENQGKPRPAERLPK